MAADYRQQQEQEEEQQFIEIMQGKVKEKLQLIHQERKDRDERLLEN